MLVGILVCDKQQLSKPLPFTRCFSTYDIQSLRVHCDQPTSTGRKSLRSHGRGASGIMSAVGSDGDILLDDEDELEIEIGAATQLSFIFESFLTRWCFRYMRIYCSFNNQNIHLLIQFRFKTYIFFGRVERMTDFRMQAASVLMQIQWGEECYLYGYWYLRNREAVN